MNSKAEAMKNGTGVQQVGRKDTARDVKLSDNLAGIVQLLETFSPNNKYPELTIVMGMCDVVRDMCVCDMVSREWSLISMQMRLAQTVWNMFVKEFDERYPMGSVMSSVPVDAVNVAFERVRSLLPPGY